MTKMTALEMLAATMIRTVKVVAADGGGHIQQSTKSQSQRNDAIAMPMVTTTMTTTTTTTTKTKR